jgi:hypothetical protein
MSPACHYPAVIQPTRHLPSMSSFPGLASTRTFELPIHKGNCHSDSEPANGRWYVTVHGMAWGCKGRAIVFTMACNEEVLILAKTLHNAFFSRCTHVVA